MDKSLENTETTNAVITHTQLGFVDETIFTLMITIKMANGNIVFGNFALDEWSEQHKKRVGTKLGLDTIIRILEIAGVNTWEELNGKYIRVNKVGLGESIKVIGYVLNDDWFYVRDIKSNFIDESN